MRIFGILLILAGLSPLSFIVYAMIKAFNTGAAPDGHLIQRALTLGAIGMPILVAGVGLLAVATNKRREPGGGKRSV
ncbi:MAG: hypothetical protein JWN24_3722 [Phycisphaerales bacterium]|nr:hypothetical protein [Phycisphaerales bacterium]